MFERVLMFNTLKEFFQIFSEEKKKLIKSF